MAVTYSPIYTAQERPTVGSRIEVMGSTSAQYNGPGEVTEVDRKVVWRPDSRSAGKDDWPHGWYMDSVLKPGVTWHYIYDGKPTGNPKSPDYGKTVATPPKGQKKEQQVFYASALRVKAGWVPIINNTETGEIVWQGPLDEVYLDTVEDGKTTQSGEDKATKAAQAVLDKSFEHLFDNIAQVLQAARKK